MGAGEHHRAGKRRLSEPGTKPLKGGCVEMTTNGVLGNANAARYDPDKGLLPPNPLRPAARTCQAIAQKMDVQVNGLHGSRFAVPASPFRIRFDRACSLNSYTSHVPH